MTEAQYEVIKDMTELVREFSDSVLGMLNLYLEDTDKAKRSDLKKLYSRFPRVITNYEKVNNRFLLEFTDMELLLEPVSEIYGLYQQLTRRLTCARVLLGDMIGDFEDKIPSNYVASFNDVLYTQSLGLNAETERLFELVDAACPEETETPEPEMDDTDEMQSEMPNNLTNHLSFQIIWLAVNDLFDNYITMRGDDPAFMERHQGFSADVYKELILQSLRDFEIGGELMDIGFVLRLDQDGQETTLEFVPNGTSLFTAEKIDGYPQWEHTLHGNGEERGNLMIDIYKISEMIAMGAELEIDDPGM